MVCAGPSLWIRTFSRRGAPSTREAGVVTKRWILFSAVFLCIFSLSLWRGAPKVVPVALLFDGRDTTGAVVSRQGLQSVVLAMEYFNSRSSSRKYQPVLLSETDPFSALRAAAELNVSAVVGGISVPSPSLLSQASNRFGIPVISLAPGSFLAKGDDLVFRPRPESGGRTLGAEAKRRGMTSYSAIVSGFESGYVQEFIRDFEAGAGAPPRRTLVFSGDLNKQIDDFGRIASGMDAMLLVLPDWLAAIALRELRLRTPGLAVFASNRAVSHRTPLLAGDQGEGLLTAAVLPREWFPGESGFPGFVADTYGEHIPAITLSIGYDAVAMLDAALDRAGTTDPGAVARALAELERIESSSGPASLDAGGDLSLPRGIFSLTKQGWIPVSRPSSIPPGEVSP